MHARQGILVIRLKSMGDVLFTLPAVHALRAAFAEEPITFLVSKEYASMLQGFHGVSSIIELDRGRFRGFHPMKILTEARSLLGRMRRQQFRLAIDLQGYGETALLTRASGARERWGTVYRSARRWAYTKAVPRNLQIHPVDDQLALLKRGGISCSTVRNQFVLPQFALDKAVKFFSNCGLRTDRPTLFIQPFTSSSQKNWSLERYLEVGQLWRKREWQVLFGGGPEDRGALQPAVAAGYPVSAGAPLLVSAGLANLSSFVLGGDTGLLHLAVATGKRVVMVMRSVLPGSTHPFQHKEWAIGPPTDALISSITTEMVDAHCVRACAELGIAPGEIRR